MAGKQAARDAMSGFEKFPSNMAPVDSFIFELDHVKHYDFLPNGFPMDIENVSSLHPEFKLHR